MMMPFMGAMVPGSAESHPFPAYPMMKPVAPKRPPHNTALLTLKAPGIVDSTPVILNTAAVTANQQLEEREKPG
jgi:hypothetical protein